MQTNLREDLRKLRIPVLIASIAFVFLTRVPGPFPGCSPGRTGDRLIRIVLFRGIGALVMLLYCLIKAPVVVM